MLTCIIAAYRVHTLMAVMAVAICFVAVPSQASSVVLDLDNNGRLVGATGLEINGSVFSVEFLGGTCVDVFGGCDDSSDFAFNTEADAAAAGQVLLDRVFVSSPLGVFDTDPSLTGSCTNLTLCPAVIPFDLTQDGMDILTSTVLNFTAFAGTDSLASETIGIGIDVSISGFQQPPRTFARFTEVSPVPLPAAAWLFISGLGGLAAMRRRHLSKGARIALA